MELREATLSLWAKSDRDGPWHPLYAHLLDVAASADAVLDLEPSSTLELIGADLELEPEDARRWTITLAGLHDLGKASPAFQCKWPPGRERVAKLGLSFKQCSPDVPHGTISDKLLTDLLQAYGWSKTTARFVANAVGAHHGYRADPHDLRQVHLDRHQGTGDWSTVQEELVQALMDTCGAGSAPVLRELSGAAFQRLAGLTSFADWIGSGLDRPEPVADLEAYFQRAKGCAHEKLREVGWPDRRSRHEVPAGIESAFAYLGSDTAPFRARELQRVVENLVDQDDTSDPALLIIEAPMGEGKTEAALYAHVALSSSAGHRGLYVALPTQATSNGLFGRVASFLESLGYEDPPDLQLLHGGKDLSDEFEALRIRPSVPTDPEDADRAVVAREWFTNRKRALLSEHGVGTVDQALLSVLPVAHQFVRMWGLANRTVVLDEVHAYDTYTSGLIVTMLRWLHALGSSAVVMSATLPRAARAAIAQAYGVNDVSDAPYPRVTIVRGGRQRTVSFDSDASRAVSIRLEAAPLGVDALAQRAVELVHDGGCVACVVNTVGRAQRLYRHLLERLDEHDIDLFHARYPAGQRQQIESDVLAAYGKLRPSYGMPGAAKRRVLVATQVVEQSLDLDFDAMITDLAPIDLVLQRAGRMHRHRRDRPLGMREARLLVAGMEPDAQGLPDLASEYFDRIYEPYVLLMSWIRLRNKDMLQLPADIDPLVQAVYGDSIRSVPDHMQSALQAASDKMNVTDLNDRGDAVAASIGDPDDRSWFEVKRLPWDDVDGSEEAAAERMAAQTRKGGPTVTVVPLHRHEGTLTLDAKGEHKAPYGYIDMAGARALQLRAIRLGRIEMVRELRNLPGLPGWDSHPLTRYLVPLRLTYGRATFGRLEVELDEELGLVYRSP